MTNEMKETISALIDGELSESQMQQMLHELCDSAEQRSRWERYHLIGDAMRSSLPKGVDRLLCERINSAISTGVDPSDSFVVTTDFTAARAKPNKESAPSFSAKPLAGLALAASVAVVAFIGFGLVVEEDVATPRLASVPSLPLERATTALPSEAVSVVSQRLQPQPQQSDRWNGAQPALGSKLNAYFSDHQGFSGAAGMNGRMLPHVQIVGFSVDKTE